MKRSNLALGSSNTITVGNQGQLWLTDRSTDGSGGTTDTQGGIISGVRGNTRYAVIVNSGGEMARGQTGDTKNNGGVEIDRPIENNGGAVDIYAGDRLDISGVDGNGNALYQLGSSAVTTIYNWTTHVPMNFVGSLVTASDATIRSGNAAATYGNIDIKGGKLILQTYYSITAPPAYPSILMGPIVTSNNATPGTLTIEVGGPLVVTAHGRGNDFLIAQIAGNLTFGDGSHYLPDCWSNAARMCELDVVAAGSSNNNYNIYIGAEGSQCIMQDLGGDAWTEGAHDSVLYNSTGGTNDNNFASNQDSNGNVFSWSWTNSRYTLTY